MLLSSSISGNLVHAQPSLCLCHIITSQANHVLFSLIFFFFPHCAGSSLLPGLSLVVESRQLTSCGQVQASHCGGCSCCGPQRTSVAVVHGCQNSSSGAVPHRLSCSAAHGIVLDQGSNECPLRCKADS